MEIAKLKSHYDSYRRVQKYDEALALRDENIDIMRWTRNYEAVRKEMGRARKKIGLIWDDKDISPLDKEKEIDRLNQLMVDLAKRTVTRRAEYEAERGIMPLRSTSRLSPPIIDQLFPEPVCP